MTCVVNCVTHYSPGGMAAKPTLHARKRALDRWLLSPDFTQLWVASSSCFCH